MANGKGLGHAFILGAGVAVGLAVTHLVLRTVFGQRR